MYQQVRALPIRSFLGVLSTSRCPALICSLLLFPHLAFCSADVAGSRLVACSNALIALPRLLRFHGRAKPSSWLPSLASRVSFLLCVLLFFLDDVDLVDDSVPR